MGGDGLAQKTLQRCWIRHVQHGMPLGQQMQGLDRYTERPSVFVGAYDEATGEVQAFHSEIGGAHAEEAARAAMPAAQLTEPMGWRQPRGATDEIWKPIGVCARCQAQFSPELFPPGTQGDSGGSVGSMNQGVFQRQLALSPWKLARSGRGDASIVSDRLSVALLVDDESADDAFTDLENLVVSQGNLFECAPLVVAAILAALADNAIPGANLALSLDLLGRILAGRSDPSEVARGTERIEVFVVSEAMKGYWLLVRVAQDRDPFNAWKAASAILDVLDRPHARALLEESNDSGE